jgi:hypothetical protein
LTVRSVDPILHGMELALKLDGEIRERWIASAEPHRWSGPISDVDPLDVAVVAPSSHLTLCSSMVRVYAGFELDTKASLFVTTADGALEAELVFVGPSGWNRKIVEDALVAAGFVTRGWSNETLRLVGSEGTVGSRVVSIADGIRRVDFQIATISDLCLSLVPSGPFEPGAGSSLHTSTGKVAAGLEAVDGGPLRIEVERVAPFFDELSARVTGNRVHFVYPGRYSVTLVGSGRRLAHATADVRAAHRVPVSAVPVHVERIGTSAYDATVIAARCPPCASIVVLSAPRARYRVVQNAASKVEETLWDFIRDRLAAEENVLVSWPGLALGDTGGRILRRLRADEPHVSVAHLSYPAPRGEIASDETHARTLRAHRVLCSAPATATINRFDAYLCTKCPGSPRLKTDNSRIWQECPDCGYADRDLIVTLAGMRSSDVQVLFADFRIAKYLSRGRGRQYAGAFGRSVRCSGCHRLQGAFTNLAPWDRVELHGLLRALAGTWNGKDEARSVRRAAYVAARRAHRSRPNDAARLEDALRRLIVSGIIQDGQVTESRWLERLQAGVSLCCERPLMWSNRRASYIFLDLEELLDPAIPASMHPDLTSGQAGVGQFLALSE